MEPAPIPSTAKKGVPVLVTYNTDATMDHTPVRFEGASETHEDKKTGQPHHHEEDVDGDGDIDLVLHCPLSDTNLMCSSLEGTLLGETFAGGAIFGSGTIRMSDIVKK